MNDTALLDTATPARPERLPRSPYGIYGPDGRKFPWGPIQAIHSISGIDVVEYLIDMSNHAGNGPDGYADHGATRYHPYIDGKDTSRSYDSLDSALVGAVAIRREGPNTRAAEYFDRITGV